MTPEQQRKAACLQVAADLRYGAIQADNQVHPLRELAFNHWLEKNSWMPADVNLWIACVGMRMEWQR